MVKRVVQEAGVVDDVAEATPVAEDVEQDTVAETIVEESALVPVVTQPVAAQQAAGAPALPVLLTKVRDKRVWIPALIVLLVVLVGGTFFAVNQARDAAARKAAVAAANAVKAAAAKEQEKVLVVDFDKAMASRDSILKAEAAVNTSIEAAKSAVASYKKKLTARTKRVASVRAAYNRRYAYVQNWNTDMSLPGFLDYPAPPNYPAKVAVPDFAKQIKALRKADVLLRGVAATLTELKIDPKFDSLHTQLIDACKALSDESLHDADVLTTCTKGTTLDSGLVKTLRTGSAEALLRVANTQAVKFVTDHKLDLRLYDVPGGRDVNEADSSLLVAAGS